MGKFVSKEGEISYTLRGEGGRHFLLVHGSGGNQETVESTAVHYSAMGKVLTSDLLGHGSSSTPKIEYTPNVFADSLIQLCKYENLHHIILVGMNYGANIGVTMAQIAPDLISHLILIEPPMFLEPWIIEILEQRIKDLEHPKENWAEETVNSLIKKTSPLERERALKALQMTPPFVKASTFKNLILWDKELSFRCSIPTLLVQIAQPLCAEERVRLIFSNLEVGRVVGSGPWINLEVPMQLHSMIDRFLDLYPSESSLGPVLKDRDSSRATSSNTDSLAFAD